MWIVHLVLRSFAAWQFYEAMAIFSSIGLTLIAVFFALPSMIMEHINKYGPEAKAEHRRRQDIYDLKMMWLEEQNHFEDGISETFEDFSLRMTGNKIDLDA